MAAPEHGEVPPEFAQMLKSMVDTLAGKVAENVPRLACSACARMPERLRRCGGTCGGAAKYCNADCAKAHWRTHKLVCGKAPKTAEASADRGGERALLLEAVEAVRFGNSDELATLLARGAPAGRLTGRSCVDWPHLSLLHVCCMFGYKMEAQRMACLRLLCAAPDVDVNLRCGDPCAAPGIKNTQETALMLAVMYLPAAVPLLLAAGARADLTDWHGATATSLVSKSRGTPAQRDAMAAQLAAALAREAAGPEAQEAERLREAGNVAFRAGDWDSAIAHYAASLKTRVDPRTLANMAAAHMQRAIGLARSAGPMPQSSDWPGSDEELRAALEAWVTLLRAERAAWHEALTFGCQARSLNPKCPKVRYRVARAHAGIRDMPRALVAAREGLDACPGDAKLAALAAALAGLGVRDDGFVNSASSPDAARANAMLRGPGGDDVPAGPCPYCGGGVPTPFSLWHGACPFCLCSLDAQLPPGALDAIRLG